MALDHLAHLRRDGARFAELARSGDPSARVPCCPDWAFADLVGHLGGVHRVQRQRILSGTAERTDVVRPTPPSDGLADWYDEGLAALVDAIETTDPARPAWNWSAHEPKTAAFWPRRMAQETAVHRWDAESSVADTTPIDPELAADGVDEWLAVHLDSDIQDPDTEPPPPDTGTLHLHCTDTPGEWWAALTGRDLTVVREHRKADVAARGRAEDLLLVCWRRRPTSAVEVLGDAAVLDRWLDLSEG